MRVLVDSSVWVEYLRDGSAQDDRLEWLITEGLAVTNQLILAELLPPLLLRRQNRLANLLREMESLSLHVHWDDIVDHQVTCLRHGINRVGIPDLIIAQNARSHSVPLFTRDKHFRLMARHVGLEIF